MVRHGSQDLMRFIDVPLIRSPGAARAENRRQIGRSNRPITGPTAAWHSASIGLVLDKNAVAAAHIDTSQNASSRSC